jgi:urease accessory protein UreF
VSDDENQETLVAVARVMADHLYAAVQSITSAAWCQRLLSVEPENLMQIAVELHDYAHGIKSALQTEEQDAQSTETE